MSRLVQSPQMELHAKLEPLVEERQALIEQREELIAAINDISDRIGTELALADQKTIRVAGYQVSLVENPGRLTLDKHRLIELGVSLQDIAAATTRGAAYTTLQVKRVAER